MARTMALGILMLVAGCGTSDPSTWESCSGCAETAGAQWDVIADGAELSGGYDVLGPPDPYICLTVQGQTHCSTHVSDSADPRWDYTLVRALPTAALTDQPLAVNLWDKDTGGLDTNDFICSAQIQITDADLDAGGVQFNCSRGKAAFRFHLAH